MENKYYTPTIEEFHVGFEYELDYDERRMYGHRDLHWQPELGWNSVTVPLDSRLKCFKDYINEGKIRVKYLDEEDITSLGFKWSCSCDNYSLYSSKDFIDAGVKKYLRITHYEEKNICHIETLESGRLGRYLTKFDGIIKNKSELKRIVNQIGYGR